MEQIYCRQYNHSDAADLVRTILKAVDYIHGCGIVHRGMYCTIFILDLVIFLFNLYFLSLRICFVYSYIKLSRFHLSSLYIHFFYGFELLLTDNLLSFYSINIITIYLLPVTRTKDLKPENLIFLTKKEDADIMIADFGLSRIMDEDKLQLLTEICGTPGVRSLFLKLILTSKINILIQLAVLVHGS